MTGVRSSMARWPAAYALAMGFLFCAGPLRAQDAEEALAPESAEQAFDPAERDDLSDGDGWWHGVLGAPEPDRLYGGLWALHLRRMHDGLSAHHLMGVGWRGAYAATFINSHGNRSWGVGLARSVASVEGGDLGASLGYRAGVVAGYDGRLHDLAERWPAIPSAEIVASFSYGRMGLHASWAAIVTSFGIFIDL